MIPRSEPLYHNAEARMYNFLTVTHLNGGLKDQWPFPVFFGCCCCIYCYKMFLPPLIFNMLLVIFQTIITPLPLASKLGTNEPPLPVPFCIICLINTIPMKKSPTTSIISTTTISKVIKGNGHHHQWNILIQPDVATSIMLSPKLAATTE